MVHILLKPGLEDFEYYSTSLVNSLAVQMVRTLCFYCRGSGLIPGRGIKILQA